MKMKAKVVGLLPYVGPDGPQPAIPQGVCGIEFHGGTVTLTWIEGDGEQTAVISREEFDQHVQSGTLVLLP